MPSSRDTTRLTPYAHLPRTYRDLHIVHSTVDAFGRAHWLLSTRRPDPRGADPYDAVVITVEDGRSWETHLSAVRAQCRRLDALPDGGFVLAVPPCRKGDEHIQVFDALGRSSWTFRPGGALKDLQADAKGDLWTGYCTEDLYGDSGNDDLPRPPGLRRWSSTGEPLREYETGLGHGLLNVAEDAVWVCPEDGPLLEIRDNHIGPGGHTVPGARSVLARASPYKGAHGFAVHGDQVVFLGPSAGDRDRLVQCRLTERSVEPTAHERLVAPDGTDIGTARHRVICRGSHIYIQQEPFRNWTVLNIDGPPTPPATLPT